MDLKSLLKDLEVFANVDPGAFIGTEGDLLCIYVDPIAVATSSLVPNLDLLEGDWDYDDEGTFFCDPNEYVEDEDLEGDELGDRDELQFHEPRAYAEEKSPRDFNRVPRPSAGDALGW